MDQGLLLQLGIGVLLGASFSTLVHSFRQDILTPPLLNLFSQGFSFIFSKRVFLTPRLGTLLRNVFIVLSPGATRSAYSTLADAKADGANTWNLGLFLENALDFLFTALLIFWILRLFKRLFYQGKKDQMLCPACLSCIPLGAHRCRFCTLSL